MTDKKQQFKSLWVRWVIKNESIICQHIQVSCELQGEWSCTYSLFMHTLNFLNLVVFKRIFAIWLCCLLSYAPMFASSYTFSTLFSGNRCLTFINIFSWLFWFYSEHPTKQPSTMPTKTPTLPPTLSPKGWSLVNECHFF